MKRCPLRRSAEPGYVAEFGECIGPDCAWFNHALKVCSVLYLVGCVSVLSNLGEDDGKLRVQIVEGKDDNPDGYEQD